MAEMRCEQVRGLMVAERAATPEASRHVAECPDCRDVLATILAERFAVPLPAAAAVDELLDDLPAYLDCAQADGEVSAAARFPVVWWRTWASPDCAEVAQLTRELMADAADAPEAAPAPAGPQAGPWPELRLSRPFLQAVFAPQAALGAAWGEGDVALLVAEESDGIYRIAVYARPVGAGTWALSVVTSPAVRAQAVLRFGRKVFRTPFDQTGTATVAVPATLLTSALGPPLQVRIEPLRGSALTGA